MEVAALFHIPGSSGPRDRAEHTPAGSVQRLVPRATRPHENHSGREAKLKGLEGAHRVFRLLWLPDEEAPAYPDNLTEREVEVLRLLAQGMSTSETAKELVISPATVARHVSNILNKTGLSNRTEVAVEGAVAAYLCDDRGRRTGVIYGSQSRRADDPLSRFNEPPRPGSREKDIYGTPECGVG